MPTSDPQTILLAQDRWAMLNLLTACQSLSTEQLHQPFEIGPGTLHATIIHIIGAVQGWGDLLAGREQRPRLEHEKKSATIDELKSLFVSTYDDFEASANNHPPDEVVTGSRGGRSYSFVRGAVITHVTTHGMHHRAQCLNMLRHLGVEPLPHSAVVEWIMMVDDVPSAE